MIGGTEALVDRLVQGAAPVRRLRPAWVRAAAYLTVAALVLAGLAAWRGPRADLVVRMADPAFALGLALALATGIAGAWAALMLAAADRARGWILLPLLAALGWVGAVGVGCLGAWEPLDPAAVSGAELGNCLLTAALAGTPLTLAMLWLLRRAAPLRPGLPLAAGALAAAGFAGLALGLLHAIAASAMVLGWTGLVVALALLAHAGAARWWGPRSA